MTLHALAVEAVRDLVAPYLSSLLPSRRDVVRISEDAYKAGFVQAVNYLITNEINLETLKEMARNHERLP